MKGVNVDATVALARRTTLPVIASGGVKDLADIEELDRYSSEGIEGVIVGRALYDGRITLKSALRFART